MKHFFSVSSEVKVMKTVLGALLDIIVRARTKGTNTESKSCQGLW